MILLLLLSFLPQNSLAAGTHFALPPQPTVITQGPALDTGAMVTALWQTVSDSEIQVSLRKFARGEGKLEFQQTFRKDELFSDGRDFRLAVSPQGNRAILKINAGKNLLVDLAAAKAEPLDGPDSSHSYSAFTFLSDDQIALVTDGEAEAWEYRVSTRAKVRVGEIKGLGDSSKLWRVPGSSLWMVVGGYDTWVVNAAAKKVTSMRALLKFDFEAVAPVVQGAGLLFQRRPIAPTPGKVSFWIYDPQTASLKDYSVEGMAGDLYGVTLGSDSEVLIHTWDRGTNNLYSYSLLKKTVTPVFQGSSIWLTDSKVAKRIDADRVALTTSFCTLVVRLSTNSEIGCYNSFQPATGEAFEYDTRSYVLTEVNSESLAPVARFGLREFVTEGSLAVSQDGQTAFVNGSDLYRVDAKTGRFDSLSQSNLRRTDLPAEKRKLLSQFFFGDAKLGRCGSQLFVGMRGTLAAFDAASGAFEGIVGQGYDPQDPRFLCSEEQHAFLVKDDYSGCLAIAVSTDNLSPLLPDNLLRDVNCKSGLDPSKRYVFVGQIENGVGTSLNSLFDLQTRQLLFSQAKSLLRPEAMSVGSDGTFSFIGQVRDVSCGMNCDYSAGWEKRDATGKQLDLERFPQTHGWIGGYVLAARWLYQPTKPNYTIFDSATLASAPGETIAALSPVLASNLDLEEGDDEFMMSTNEHGTLTIFSKTNLGIRAQIPLASYRSPRFLDANGLAVEDVDHHRWDLYSRTDFSPLGSFDGAADEPPSRPVRSWVWDDRPNLPMVLMGIH